MRRTPGRFADYSDARCPLSQLRRLGCVSQRPSVPSRGTGCLCAVDDLFAAVGLFDRPATLRKVWARLVTGYAMDALGRQGRKGPAFEPRGPKAITERLGQIACEAYPSPGLCEDWRFAAEDLTGHALVVDGACVTLSAFPNDAGTATEGRSGRHGADGPRVQLPSERRRRPEG